MWRNTGALLVVRILFEPYTVYSCKKKYQCWKWTRKTTLADYFIQYKTTPTALFPKRSTSELLSRNHCTPKTALQGTIIRITTLKETLALFSECKMKGSISTSITSHKLAGKAG